jgi:hypothetical protein
MANTSVVIHNGKPQRVMRYDDGLTYGEDLCVENHDKLCGHCGDCGSTKTGHAVHNLPQSDGGDRFYNVVDPSDVKDVADVPLLGTGGLQNEGQQQEDEPVQNADPDGEGVPLLGVPKLNVGKPKADSKGKTVQNDEGDDLPPLLGTPGDRR